MRTVSILAFLALVALSFAAIGAEPVSVGGDFGAAWLKNLPYQPTAATDEKDGLWSWGGTPRWMTIANGTLEKVKSIVERRRITCTPAPTAAAVILTTHGSRPSLRERFRRLFSAR